MARLTLVLAAMSLACSVRERPTSLEGDVPFACSADVDCPAGTCLAEFGICTREGGALDNVLFEVTPQASDPVYGGARFLTLKSVASTVAPGERLELNVKPRVPVTGRVIAAPGLEACVSPARTTLPVVLTFTPRERLLGLSVPSYEIETDFDARIDVLEWVFNGSLPPGRYDVYMRPKYGSLTDQCHAIPQIFRDQSIGLLKGEDDRLELRQPQPSALRLTIPWDARLEGWTLDMVHPVTGEVVSNVVVLRGADVDPDTNALVTTLDYSHAESDFAGVTDELVRLTPGPDVTAGTVLLYRSGLETFSPGEGTIANVSSFGKPIPFQAWVWKQGAEDTPVPGSVTFSALELDEVNEGVFTSFETTTSVDATGQVKANLLPGRYRVRVTPPALEIARLGLRTGYETSVTVWADESGSPQGGHVIEVPPALSLTGQVVAAVDARPLRRVDVRATAADADRNLCPTPADGSTPTCERPLAPLLQRALAQDPFVPRTRDGLSGSDGTYTVDGLDCGRCEEGGSTSFDLTARPAVTTGLPWVVRTTVDPFRDAEEMASTPLRVPLPVARPIRVTYGEPLIDPGPDKQENTADDSQDIVGLSGALVRVFAVLDGQGRVARDPRSPPCISALSPDSANCLDSLMQVAEARTDDSGEFLLLLPPDLE